MRNPIRYIREGIQNIKDDFNPYRAFTLMSAGFTGFITCFNVYIGAAAGASTLGASLITYYATRERLENKLEVTEEPKEEPKE